MQFNSLAYFALLLAAVLISARLPFRSQNLFLVGISYAFYAVWDWRFCGLMLFATAIGYWPALCIERCFENGDQKSAKRWLVLSIALCLAVLAFFKYAGFFIESLQTLTGSKLSLPIQIILPVGISFYIFHTISYVVDVYRKQLTPTRYFSELALFLAFFPQLIAGPIARASSLLPQCQTPRKVTATDWHEGLALIFIGLFRKVVIADTAGAIVDKNFGLVHSLSTPALLATLGLYALQIYGDFAGYSDLARGSARLFGFKLIRNFNHPYWAQNVSDFWQRWHISLSSWLRDYLYIPLGGSRRGKFRTYVNLMITMLLGGLWHGASWNFVFWGLIHGIYLVIHHLRGGSAKTTTTGSMAMLNRVGIFTLICFTWLFFRSPDTSVTLAFLKGIALLRFGGGGFLVATFLLLVGFTLLVDWPQIKRGSDTAFLSFKPVTRWIYASALLILIVLSGDLPTKPFIYFQF